MRQLLQAVEYLNTQGIVHRDLKPDNVLVGNHDGNVSIKIADFGLSAKYDQRFFETMSKQCGTIIFMAPEVAAKQEYSKRVDIFSTGIIMY